MPTLIVPIDTTELVTAVARIVLILALTVVAQRLLKRFIPHLVRIALQRQAAEEPSEAVAKREQTLTSVLLESLTIPLYLVVGLTLLSELRIDIGPALASLGLLGIAVGFGAQNLVRDLFSGLFILLENQYRIGDVVRIAGIEGLVEDINLRRTVLRDLDGVVHSIPNGEVKISSNFTKHFSRVNLDISVAYSTDVDVARDVINRVGQEMATDPEFGPMITEAPHFLRLDAFEDSGITLKVLGVTQPIRQWEVAGEFRRRILKAFAQAGIEIPFPHRVVISRTEPPPQQSPGPGVEV